MKILLIGSFKYPMYAVAFKNAWEEMGHSVEPVDYEAFLYKECGVIPRLLNRIQSRYLLGIPMLAYNKAIIKKVEEYEPDLVFLYRCNNIYGSTIRAIKDKSIVFSYHNDDPFGGVPANAFYRCCVNNWVSFFPTVSKVRNWGRDGSGLHGQTDETDPCYNQSIDEADTFEYDDIKIENLEIKSLNKYFSNVYSKAIRKKADKLKFWK